MQDARTSPILTVGGADDKDLVDALGLQLVVRLHKARYV